MKVALESTDLIIKIKSHRHDGVEIEARVWEGVTESGIPIQAMICQLAVQDSQRQDEFTAELIERPRPPAQPQAWPLRYFID